VFVYDIAVFVELLIDDVCLVFGVAIVTSDLGVVDLVCCVVLLFGLWCIVIVL